MPKRKQVKVQRKEESMVIKVLTVFSFFIMSIPTYIIVQYLIFGLSLKTLAITPSSISLEINPVFMLFVLYYLFIVSLSHMWVKRHLKQGRINI